MEKLAARNASQVLDVLSGRLAFERTGVKLYDAAIQKIERNPEPRYHRLLDYLRRIRHEEKEHEEWLEAQIRSLGGTAHETTTMSELETEESKGVVAVIVDGHQQVPHLLHALLAAELADNAGWELLVKLADDAGDRDAKRQFQRRLLDEVKHLAFLREAVVRATEIEVLGRDLEMPESAASVPRRVATRPLAIGVLTFGLIGAGVAVAAAIRASR